MPVMESKNKPQQLQAYWNKPLLDIQNTYTGLQGLKPTVDGGSDDFCSLLEQMLRDDFVSVLGDAKADALADMHVKSYERWSKGLREERTRAQVKILSEKIGLMIDIGRCFTVSAKQLAKAAPYQLHIIKEYAVMPNLDSIYMFSTDRRTDFWFVLLTDERSVSLSYVEKFTSMQEKYPKESLDFIIIEKSQLIVDEIPPYSAFLMKREGVGNIE